MRKFILSSTHNFSFKGVGHSGGGGVEEIAEGRGGGIKVLKFDSKPLLHRTRKRTY
jgi:hypothetical protein